MLSFIFQKKVTELKKLKNYLTNTFILGYDDFPLPVKGENTLELLNAANDFKIKEELRKIVLEFLYDVLIELNADTENDKVQITKWRKKIDLLN